MTPKKKNLTAPNWWIKGQKLTFPIESLLPKQNFDFIFQVIEKFRKFATLHDVHVTLVIHPRKEISEHLTGDSIFGGAKATQEADNVILLQKEEVMANVTRKYIEVVKNR